MSTIKTLNKGNIGILLLYSTIHVYNVYSILMFKKDYKNKY